MRVVHIGTADNRGGAARASFQLHEGLLRAGHDSKMLVGQRFEQRPEIERIGWPRNIIGRIGTRLVLEFETHTGLQYLLTPWRDDFLNHSFTRNAEIIHLHNLHGNFFSPLLLPELSAIAPLVWTLHDTWSVTGHCTYNYDCDRWRIGCGECPNLEEHPKISVDTTAYLWGIKKTAYDHSDITVVAPSKWLARMASESPLLRRFDVRCIPYGLDTERFKPIDRLKARQELSIPGDVNVMMIVVLPGGERKGADYFVRALPRMNSHTRPWILAVGGKGLLTAPEGFHIRELGYLTTEQMMLCYSASDVFVLPTLADNLPVSLLEAHACGTPAVAFDIGGVSDIVQHMRTGYLARHKDADDLGRGLDAVLQHPGLRGELRVHARQRVESEFSAKLQIERYVDLYRTISERRPSTATTISM